MFSAIHIYAMLRELKKFESKNVFGLKKTQNQIFINTGKEGIFLSIYPGKPYISIDKTRGEIILYSTLPGLRIEGITQIDFDRVIEIDLEDNIHIYMEVTGKSSNLIITQGNKILWVYRNIEKRDIFPNSVYNLPSPSRGIDPLNTDGIGEKIIAGEKIQGLSKGFIRFLSQIPIENIDVFFKKISLGECKPVVYVKDIPIAVMPYSIPVHYEERFFPKMSDAINFYYNEVIASETREREKMLIISGIDKKIKKIDREIERLSSKEDDFNQYRTMGEALLFNQDRIKRGEVEVTLANPYNLDEQLKIKIEPRMGIVENANMYFKKYKKMKSFSEKRARIIKKFMNKKNKLIQEKERVEKGAFIQVKRQEKGKQIPSKFRVFETKNHYNVLVGKNAKSNEGLLKSATLYDIFFHVRGSGGSYTILKRMDKNKQVPQMDIEMAASIAAFFSKQKHSNLVPVSYTEVRYVRKPKKAKPGMVILTKEKVIFVKPQKP